MLIALVDRTACRLDLARAALLRTSLGVPALAAIVRERERRLCAMACVHVGVALALALYVPMIGFVLGPVLLGVAHVAADVRYLVLRRELPRWFRRCVWIAVLGSIALRVLDGLRNTQSARLEFALVIGWVALALIAGALPAGERAGRAGVQRRGGRWRQGSGMGPQRLGASTGALASRLGVGVCALAKGRASLPRRGEGRRMASGAIMLVLLGAAALRDPEAAQLVFVHAHNLVAVGLWLWLFRSRVRAMWLPLLAITGATALLASGMLFPHQLHSSRLMSLGLHLFEASDWVAPGLPIRRAVSLTVVYVFLQSVHYSVWLLLIPQEDVKAQGSLSFRMSLRSLRADFGARGLRWIGGAALTVAAAACVHAVQARNVYLSLAMFHGYLELAMLAYFWARGGAGRAGAAVGAA